MACVVLKFLPPSKLIVAQRFLSTPSWGFLVSSLLRRKECGSHIRYYFASPLEVRDRSISGVLPESGQICRRKKRRWCASTRN
jgi:hypothetical protein